MKDVIGREDTYTLDNNNNSTILAPLINNNANEVFHTFSTISGHTC